MTDKQTLFEYRLSQAETTLHDARIMIAQGVSPRSVVNRAYYAAFYSVLALFLKAELSIQTSKHSGVIGTFDKEFILTGKIDKRFSRILHGLFDDRQEFDYKELVQISEEDAGIALKQAADFVAAINTFMQTL